MNNVERVDLPDSVFFGPVTQGPPKRADSRRGEPGGGRFAGIFGLTIVRHKTAPRR
jgi:hypothetical protein